MLATVAAADSASTVRKKHSVFVYSEAEPRAMYAIYKQTRTLCVLQYTELFWFFTCRIAKTNSTSYGYSIRVVSLRLLSLA